MTNQPHPSPNGAGRRWFQFSLRWLLAIVFVANLFFAWCFHTPPRLDRVRLYVDADSVRVNGRKVPWQELATVLQSHKERIQESGVEFEDVCVQISVNGETTYGDFKRAVRAAWDVGLKNTRLKTSRGIEPFVIAPPRHWREYEDTIPPFTVSIKVNKRGKLTQIGTPGRIYRANMLAQLQNDVLNFVGADTGPDSLRNLAFLRFVCDDRVKFQHVVAVLEAITEKAKSGGPEIPLIRIVTVRIHGYDFGYEEDVEIPEYEFEGPPDVPQPKPLTPLEIGPLITLP